VEEVVRFSIRLAALLCLAILAAAAQARPAKKTGTIMGKVTYKGKPLPGGTVTFHPAKGKAITGIIQPDGTYAVKDVPLGPAKVAIETESVKPKPGAAPKGGKYIPIPAKYASPKTSGLTYMVAAGKQTLDIVLE
jgi:hypothetical protein